MGVFGGSRDQVGAVWAPERRLEAIWTVKTVTDRVSRAVGTAKSRQNLVGRFGLAVGVMRIMPDRLHLNPDLSHAGVQSLSNQQVI